MSTSETPQEEQPAPDPEEGAAAGEDAPSEEQEKEELENVTEPTEGQPEASIEEARKAADKATARIATAKGNYAKKLVEILGDDIRNFLACPRCSSEGFPFGGVPGFIPDPMFVPVDPEIANEVRASIGDAPASATKYAEWAKGCEACDGSGNVLTYSKVPQEKAKRCRSCVGKGWIDLNPQPQTREPIGAGAGAANGDGDAAVIYEPPVEHAPAADLWGRPVGDPNYGVHPMYVTVT